MEWLNDNVGSFFLSFFFLIIFGSLLWKKTWDQKSFLVKKYILSDIKKIINFFPKTIIGFWSEKEKRKKKIPLKRHNKIPQTEKGSDFFFFLVLKKIKSYFIMRYKVGKISSNICILILLTLHIKANIKLIVPYTL